MTALPSEVNAKPEPPAHEPPSKSPNNWYIEQSNGFPSNSATNVSSEEILSTTYLLLDTPAFTSVVAPDIPVVLLSDFNW